MEFFKFHFSLLLALKNTTALCKLTLVPVVFHFRISLGLVGFLLAYLFCFFFFFVAYFLRFSIYVIILSPQKDHCISFFPITVLYCFLALLQWLGPSLQCGIEAVRRNILALS